MVGLEEVFLGPDVDSGKQERTAMESSGVLRKAKEQQRYTRAQQQQTAAISACQVHGGDTSETRYTSNAGIRIRGSALLQ